MYYSLFNSLDSLFMLYVYYIVLVGERKYGKVESTLQRGSSSDAYILFFTLAEELVICALGKFYVISNSVLIVVDNDIKFCS